MNTKIVLTLPLVLLFSTIANAQVQPKVKVVQVDTLIEKLNLNLCDFTNTEHLSSLNEKDLKTYFKNSMEPYKSQMRIFKPDALFKYTMPVHIPKTDEKLHLQILEPEVRSRNQQS